MLYDKQELEQARLNRERVKQGIGNQFYQEQANAVAQWGFGEPKPESVIVGELPYVGHHKPDTNLTA